jgi:hypothetical protein
MTSHAHLDLEKWMLTLIDSRRSTAVKNEAPVKDGRIVHADCVARLRHFFPRLWFKDRCAQRLGRTHGIEIFP